jgi:glycosyltransferase involved in cell wall biosynthesis
MIVAPFVSVVIPAFNQADFLAETIQSVLTQTFKDFEIIVVNDASPDHTEAVVKQFHDSHLCYIRHEQNRGLPAARNTGMRAAQGELIALLDSDDLFHPEKLQTHVNFLAEHHDVGVTYNSRFELNYSAKTIRSLVRPPVATTLADFVLGFPFTPSDMVIRRDWAGRVNYFDENYVSGGEDLDFPCRLALAGCKFANVDRALNYRRHHSGRIKKRLPARLDDYLRALNTTFSDPRCPADVLVLRKEAYANRYLEVAMYALFQGETADGRAWIREALALQPAIIEGFPSRLLNLLLSHSIADEGQDHESLLRFVFEQLQPDLPELWDQLNWAVARGYLLKGLRAVMWERMAEDNVYFTRTKALNAEIDELFLQTLAYQLMLFEREFGEGAGHKALQRFTPHLVQLGGWRTLRKLKGIYAINRAFLSFKTQKYGKVLTNVGWAVTNDPSYLGNRGVMSILARSLMGGQPVENK